MKPKKMKAVKRYAVIEGLNSEVAQFWDSGRNVSFLAIVETREEAFALKPKATSGSRVVRVSISELPPKRKAPPKHTIICGQCQQRFDVNANPGPHKCEPKRKGKR